MPPHTMDRTTLEGLKRQAIERAAHLSHRLEPFRTAKHDPLCYVSFCADCRQMVIISLEHGDRDGDDRGALYGYALEAPCAAHSDGHRHEMIGAGSR